MSSPPCSCCRSDSSASVSSVTLCATRRVPAAISRPDRVEHRRIEAAADEDGVGLSERRQRRRRSSRDDADLVRETKGLGVGADVRDAILPRLDRDRRSAGSAHSTEIEPEPAPMSHSLSPGRGASAESASARIGRLVIWPSCPKRSSARPELRGSPAAPSASIASANGLPRRRPRKLSALLSAMRFARPAQRR